MSKTCAKWFFCNLDSFQERCSPVKVQSLAYLSSKSLVSEKRAVNILQETVTGINRTELEQLKKFRVWQILPFMRQLCSKRQTIGEALIQVTTAWQSAHRCFFSKLDAVSPWKGQIAEASEWQMWSPALTCAVRLAGGSYGGNTSARCHTCLKGEISKGAALANQLFFSLCTNCLVPWGVSQCGVWM